MRPCDRDGCEDPIHAIDPYHSASLCLEHFHRIMEIRMGDCECGASFTKSWDRADMRRYCQRCRPSD